MSCSGSRREEVMHAFRIGRVFGIEVRVDWSWVFIFVLLTWNLVAVFTQWHPDWSPVGALAIAVTASLIFFGCVLLHELAHSVVASGYGLRVRSITLFLFGGVSNIEHEPPSARAELFTAIAGPMTSIVLGAGFLLLASLLTPVSLEPLDATWSAVARLGPLATLLAWLGPINIVIGLFNLVPGFPLDGGRVLRSLLWSLSHDLRWATRVASAAGQTMGWLFIAGGIAMTFGARLPFFGTGLVAGIWLAFIGWFLHSAASQAVTRLALDDALAGMTVEQLMKRQGPAVAPDLTVAALVHEHMIPGDERALPVLENGVLLGLVSVSDVQTIPPDEWAETRVGSIMQRIESVPVTTPEEPLATAFERLVRRDIEQLPVVVGGKLAGMLHRRDVTRWIELAWRPGASAARPGDGVAGRAGARSIRRRGGPPFSGAGAHHPA
jgi:Zn-dependent protease/CBS domain-containing protein